MIKRLPNMVSVLRVLLSVPLFVSIATGSWAVAFWLFVTACITDTIDGPLARLFDVVSNIGSSASRLFELPTRYRDWPLRRLLGLDTSASYKGGNMTPRADHEGGNGGWYFDSEPDPDMSGWFMLALIHLFMILPILWLMIEQLQHPLLLLRP